MPPLSHVLYAGLRAGGITAAARSMRDGALILAYHNVVPPHFSSAGDPGVHLPFTRFRRQIEWVARHYQVVPLTELLERIASGRRLTRSAAITFDDGYAGVLKCAWPFLRERHLPATLFPVAEHAATGAGFWWDDVAATRVDDPAARAQWITELRGDGRLVRARLSNGRVTPALPSFARPAGWEALAEAVATGLEIGAHTATHRALPALTDQELDHELSAPRIQIREQLGVEPRILAYPYGAWDTRVRDAVVAAGYDGAVTLDFGLNRVGTDPWSLRRVNVPANADDAVFQGRAAGLGRPERWR